MRSVLDSWALIAWLQGDAQGRRTVTRLLADAEAGNAELVMSMINVGEVFYLLAKRAGLRTAEDFLVDFAAMPIRTHAPTAPEILDAARIKARFPISYADAFAVQTARREHATLVSGDPDIRKVAAAGAVDLHWLGG
jgi:ribonuclease VapC